MFTTILSITAKSWKPSERPVIADYLRKVTEQLNLENLPDSSSLILHTQPGSKFVNLSFKTYSESATSYHSHYYYLGPNHCHVSPGKSTQPFPMILTSLSSTSHCSAVSTLVPCSRQPTHPPVSKPFYNQAQMMHQCPYSSWSPHLCALLTLGLSGRQQVE